MKMVHQVWLFSGGGHMTLTVDESTARDFLTTWVKWRREMDATATTVPRNLLNGVNGEQSNHMIGGLDFAIHLPSVVGSYCFPVKDGPTPAEVSAKAIEKLVEKMDDGESWKHEHGG